MKLEMSQLLVQLELFLTCVVACEMQVMGDASALNDILGSLPGVNPDDPALQTALRNLQGNNDKDSKTDGKDSK